MSHQDVMIFILMWCIVIVMSLYRLQLNKLLNVIHFYF